MMEDTIRFTAKGTLYTIPNSWEKLNQYLYEGLIRDITSMTTGEIPVAMVRINHVCRVMGWDPGKIKGDSGMENLNWLAEQVTFPFLISYPDHDAALEDLDPETRKLCKRLPPHKLTGIGLSRYLVRLPYKYSIDSCFCKQLMPVVEANGEIYRGYKIDTSFNHLTCSLTALQFIEARNLMNCSISELPLLVAILYYPESYSSGGAHELASSFTGLSLETLQAIAFNFIAFVNYLFTKTEFKLLTEGESDKKSAISTGALESLYNLSSDGLGDVDKVERMNLIQYLTILRKKLIDTVRSLHAAKMKTIDIEKETGLPIKIINKIL